MTFCFSPDPSGIAVLPHRPFRGDAVCDGKSQTAGSNRRRPLRCGDRRRMSLRTRSSSFCGFGSLAAFPSCIQAERATLGPFCNRLKARYAGTGVFLQISDFVRFLRDFRGCERFLCKLVRVYGSPGSWRQMAFAIASTIMPFSGSTIWPGRRNSQTDSPI